MILNETFLYVSGIGSPCCHGIKDVSYVSWNLLPPTKEEVHVFARVRLSVCLSIRKITQKRVHGFK